MQTNTVAGPEVSTAASSTPITKLSEADMATLQNMIGAAIGAAAKTAAVPVPTSVTSAQLFETAKALAKTTSRDELNKRLDAKKGGIETLEKELGSVVATLDRMAKQVKIDAAKEEAVMIHMALDLLDANDTNADTLYNRAVKLLGSAGITVKKSTSALSLSEQRKANQSFFSRLF